MALALHPFDHSLLCSLQGFANLTPLPFMVISFSSLKEMCGPRSASCPYRYLQTVLLCLRLVCGRCQIRGEWRQPMNTPMTCCSCLHAEKYGVHPRRRSKITRRGQEAAGRWAAVCCGSVFSVGCLGQEGSGPMLLPEVPSSVFQDP